MRKVKVHGAGSIGNHLTQAARRMGWSVHVCDIDENALRRMRDEIYPSRYGAWDEGITMSLSDEAPKGGFDLICIGTPPDSHMKLAMEAIGERPAAIQIEKPLCTPELEHADELVAAASEHGIRVFVGYDHVVGKASQKAQDVISSGALGDILTIDVEFREHWAGIFQAHPWLAGPQDTYLGFWRRGGGASGEHSHALNLWQHFAQICGVGRVVEVNSSLRYKNENGAEFDDLCLLNLRTEKGLVGRVIQDVITRPVRKNAIIQGTTASLEWINGFKPGVDAIIIKQADGSDTETLEFTKSRPDDFLEEMLHIDSCLNAGNDSPIDLKHGLDSMLAIAAAHESEKRKRAIRIDLNKGYSSLALQPA